MGLLILNEKELPNEEELEKELEKAFQKNENQKNVFEIVRNEDSSSELKEGKIKFKRNDIG